MIKSELRKAYLAKRNSLSSGEQELKSTQICSLFFTHTDLGSIGCLHCFLSISKFNEIDTHPIIERVWTDHPYVDVVVPRVNRGSGELQSLRYTRDTELVKAAWNIREPAIHDCVKTEAIDIVLVPLLCFDRRGHRVGYGKGYYDSFLAGCRPDCLKVGLSYFPPVDVIDDIGDHDVALDRCITPDGVFTFEKKS